MDASAIGTQAKDKDKLLIQKIPTCLHVIEKAFGADNTMKQLAKTFDLFIRLLVVLQIRPKGSAKVPDDVIYTAIAIIKNTVRMINIQIPASTGLTQDSVKEMILLIISLVSGFNLMEKTISTNKVPPNAIPKYLFDLFSKTIFKDKSIQKYITTDILEQLVQVIKNLSGFSVKSLSDPKFLNTVIDLMYVISGKENENSAKVAIKRADSKDMAQAPVKREVLIDLPIDLIQSLLKLTQGDFEAMYALLLVLTVIEFIPFRGRFSRTYYIIS